MLLQMVEILGLLQMYETILVIIIRILAHLADILLIQLDLMCFDYKLDHDMADIMQEYNSMVDLLERACNR